VKVKVNCQIDFKVKVLYQLQSVIEVGNHDQRREAQTILLVTVF
jgi:hypothetical protein